MEFSVQIVLWGKRRTKQVNAGGRCEARKPRQSRPVLSQNAQVFIPLRRSVIQRGLPENVALSEVIGSLLLRPSRPADCHSHRLEQQALR